MSLKTKRQFFLSEILFAPCSITTALILTITLALLWAMIILPWSSQVFMGFQNVNGDNAQHLSGWYAFRAEPWHFPLLKIDLINYPSGTTVSLLDSIPLFAIFFKLLTHYLPCTFDYNGFFIIFCCLTQGLATLILLRALEQKSLLSLLYGLLLCLSAPIFFGRFGDSLACQSIILLNFASYFFARKQKINPQQVQLLFGLLILFSLFIHPYFLLFTYTFYCASMIELTTLKIARFAQTLQYFFWINASIFLVMVLFGFAKGTHEVGGYGVFSTNLSSFFYGGRLAHYQTIDMTGGQVEGFAYLGLGALILLTSSLLMARPSLRELYKKYKGCSYAILFLTLYAILDQVYLGHLKLFSLHLPNNPLTNNFRTNGRFIWALWYALIIFSIVTIMHKKKLALMLFPIVIGLQFFDLEGYLNTTQNALHEYFFMTPNALTTQKQLSHLFSQADAVVVYPKFACTPHAPDHFFATMQLFAAKANIPINSAYVAHIQRGPCDDDAQKFSKMFTKILLIAPKATPSPTIKMLLLNWPQACTVFEDNQFCLFTQQTSLQHTLKLS
jgi:hypothetical protein